MKLSDIVSNLHLTFFAEVPLVIFFGVFLGVVIHVLQGGQRLEESKLIPLREASDGSNERRP
jgi:hypothetical protein